MNVLIVGLGYIGLPSAAIMADHGLNVKGFDTNKNIVDIISRGSIHIVEHGLEQLVKKGIDSGHLLAVENASRADVYIIAVPTPLNDDKKPDLTYLYSAITSIAPHLNKGALVIIESTIPVGTTEKLTLMLQEARADLRFPILDEVDVGLVDVHITHCPERVLPGRILEELIANDRIIGGLTDVCAQRAKKFYERFVKGKILTTSARTAELCKLAESSYRDVNIAFANELSLISNKLDVDVWELIDLANHHPRVDILKPGPGVGGHCIAVDPWFIVDSVPEESKLIKLARNINDSRPSHVVNSLIEIVKNIDKPFSEISVVCLGLAFKPNVDDLRTSPALQISKEIEHLGLAHLYLVEPNIDVLPVGFDPLCSSLVGIEKGLKNADIALLLVDHDEFVNVQPELLENIEVLDTRGMWRLLK